MGSAFCFYFISVKKAGNQLIEIKPLLIILCYLLRD